MVHIVRIQRVVCQFYGCFFHTECLWQQVFLGGDDSSDFWTKMCMLRGRRVPTTSSCAPGEYQMIVERIVLTREITG